MMVYVKYLILILGIIAGIITLSSKNIGSDITSAGVLMVFVRIKLHDLKIVNSDD
jgi:hypothetical protein